jgi:hypothetical protein
VLYELIGNWIGRYISVEVDEDGMAWGKDLRIRVVVRVDQPLLRGVPLKESEEEAEGRWFDIKYERVPHFCFDCGCLVHPVSGCSTERGDVKQWGEWLRASPRKNQKPPAAARPTVSLSSYSHFAGEPGNRRGDGVVIRDLPPRCNLAFDQAESGSSRTGGFEPRRGNEEVISPGKDYRVRDHNDRSGKGLVDSAGKRSKKGTYVRKPRQEGEIKQVEPSLLPSNTGRKRRTKQVWMQVPVRVVGEGSSESAEKRQRTTNVFDRLEEGGAGATSVFDRLEDPSADPVKQGCREQ